MQHTHILQYKAWGVDNQPSQMKTSKVVLIPKKVKESWVYGQFDKLFRILTQLNCLENISLRNIPGNFFFVILFISKCFKLKH